MAHVLVHALAAELREQAAAYFDGRPDDPAISALIEAQGATGRADYQLPDPILGLHPKARVLVIGLNPGSDPQADFPTLGGTLDAYVQFYRDRFRVTHRHPISCEPVDHRSKHGTLRVIPHYRFVESLLARGYGEQAIGKTAMYADVIPWRTTGSSIRPLLRNQAVIQLADQRVRRLLVELQPEIVITLGTFAGDRLCVHPRGGPSVNNVTVTWNGNSCEVPVVALYHPNSWARHRPPDYWEQVRSILVSQPWTTSRTN